LKDVLASLPKEKHPDLLVGLDSSDDAGVVRLSGELALIQTVDFFTPIVDDPYDFGRIAAANSLSDVYAMGGTPLTALNIVCFPIKDLPGEILAEILRGGSDTLRRAGVHLAGGHSVDDPEPKFGLSVTGTIHPEHIATNAGMRPGDALVLTKPLGTGVLTTAAKQDALDPETLALAVESMATLNAAAACAMRAVGIGPDAAVSAATDVTGFGLLGHLSHMARAANLTARIDASAVPLLPRALALAEAGFLTGGGASNLSYLEEWLEISDAVPQQLIDLLVDPQTSGGLLIAVRESSLDQLLDALEAEGVQTRAVVGGIESGPVRIRVVV
jgi:selenide,water dikinase